VNPILYCGNFRPSWSTETYVAQSFFDIGKQVVRLQEDEVSSDDCIELAGRYDPELFLYTRTWGLKDGPNAAFKVWEAMRRKGIPTATLSLDLYWGLNREPMIHEDPMFRTDVVFTADGGRQEDFKAAGINHVWLPPAVYGRDCFRGTARPEYACDVAFVGSYASYHREHPFRKLLVDTLKEKYGPRFRHFGDRNNIRGWDLNDVYASAKVVVGDQINRSYYWSDRVPETIGRGGFLLSPLTIGMYKEGFVATKTIEIYDPGNIGACLCMVEACLDKDYPRQEVSEQGMRIVIERHTYAERCKKILEVACQNFQKAL
jgi:hypothetical protein